MKKGRKKCIERPKTVCVRAFDHGLIYLDFCLSMCCFLGRALRLSRGQLPCAVVGAAAVAAGTTGAQRLVVIVGGHDDGASFFSFRRQGHRGQAGLYFTSRMHMSAFTAAAAEHHRGVTDEQNEADTETAKDADAKGWTSRRCRCRDG